MKQEKIAGLYGEVVLFGGHPEDCWYFFCIVDRFSSSSF